MASEKEIFFGSNTCKTPEGNTIVYIGSQPIILSQIQIQFPKWPTVDLYQGFNGAR